MRRGVVLAVLALPRTSTAKYVNWRADNAEQVILGYARGGRSSGSGEREVRRKGPNSRYVKRIVVAVAVAVASRRERRDETSPLSRVRKGDNANGGVRRRNGLSAAILIWRFGARRDGSGRRRGRISLPVLLAILSRSLRAAFSRERTRAARKRVSSTRARSR